MSKPSPTPRCHLTQYPWVFQRQIDFVSLSIVCFYKGNVCHCKFVDISYRTSGPTTTVQPLRLLHSLLSLALSPRSFLLSAQGGGVDAITILTHHPGFKQQITNQVGHDTPRIDHINIRHIPGN